MGSGPTGEAAHLEGMTSILFEADAAYVAKIRHCMLRVDLLTVPIGPRPIVWSSALSAAFRKGPSEWRERQQAGIARVKTAGLYKGRKPTARAKAAEIAAMAAKGISMGAIAAQLGIGKGSVHCVLLAVSATGFAGTVLKSDASRRT